MKQIYRAKQNTIGADIQKLTEYYCSRFTEINRIADIHSLTEYYYWIRYTEVNIILLEQIYGTKQKYWSRYTETNRILLEQMCRTKQNTIGADVQN